MSASPNSPFYTSHSSCTAMVLSGGGARGAYEVGVLLGLQDLLGNEPLRSIGIFAGTSIGAVHAAYVAAHRDEPDAGLRALRERWQTLRLSEILRPHFGFQGSDSRVGAALFDAGVFEQFLRNEIQWSDLHHRIKTGLLDGLIVSALHIPDGRTVSFAELAPHMRITPSSDPRRGIRTEPIESTHVLASAAMPLLLPARRIGDSYYCDGGLRFNTPISPAIRAGANRLVVIPVRSKRTHDAVTVRTSRIQNPIFLLGKVLDALLLDPVDYDIEVLERLNQLIEITSEELPQSSRLRVREVLEASRGLAYRRIDTLVIRPSEDLGRIAAATPRRTRERFRDQLARAALRWSAGLGIYEESDLLSFLLFDGAYASELIELGRRDVVANADAIRSFFRQDEAHSGRATELPSSTN